MKLYSKEGVEMMDVKSIDLDGERLVVKGKMMGTMATTIHVAPADMLGALKLLPPRAMLRIPRLLLRAWLAERRDKTR